MLNPPSPEESEFIMKLFEEKQFEWSSTWPLERRVLNIWGDSKIPVIDRKYHIKERDVLNLSGRKHSVLFIPENRVIGKEVYPLITLTRGTDDGEYGTNNILCNRIRVGNKSSLDLGSIPFKKDFEYYDLIKAELEDAGVWQSFRERGGWMKIRPRTYALDIFGVSEYSAEIIPPKEVYNIIPKSVFDWFSRELGIDLFIDDTDLTYLLHSKGISMHKIKIEKYAEPQLRNTCKGDFSFDTYFEMNGRSGFDYTYPGRAIFKDGKLVFGDVGKYEDIRTPELFKKAVVDYFKIPSYELFELFFYFKGLPKKYRDSIKDIV